MNSWQSCTGGGSVGECGRVSQPSWFLGKVKSKVKNVDLYSTSSWTSSLKCSDIAW